MVEKAEAAPLKCIEFAGDDQSKQNCCKNNHLGKVTLNIKAVGSTAQITLKTITANRSYMLSQISNLIRQKLGCKPTDSLFIYIRSSFAPPPDARIADLFDVSH